MSKPLYIKVAELELTLAQTQKEVWLTRLQLAQSEAMLCDLNIARKQEALEQGVKNNELPEGENNA